MSAYSQTPINLKIHVFCDVTLHQPVSLDTSSPADCYWQCW